MAQFEWLTKMTQIMRGWARLRGIRSQCVSSSFCACAPHGRRGGDRSDVQNAGQALRRRFLRNIIRKASERNKLKHAPLGSNPRPQCKGLCDLPTGLDLSQGGHGTIGMMKHGMMQLQKYNSNFLSRGFAPSSTLRQT